MRSSKVLLLENVAAQAAAARNALVGAGYRLVISRFEAEGKKRAREWKPDIVILSNSFVKEDIEGFCRNLREEIPSPFSLVVASPHPGEQFFQESPGLRELVDGYVQRPYSSVRLRETLQEIGAASGSAGAECDGAPAGEVKGKSILLLDRDPEVVSRVREHLEPLGVEVGVRSWDEAVAAGGAGGAQALVIGWPLPEGFTFDTLREIRGGAERLPVVLLSSAGREVVQARSPALYGASSMLFTKPVPWKHFFHFLMRILRQAPALPDEAGVSPSAEGEADLRRSFQSQLEAKFLEVEELKSRLREVEKRKGTAPETAAFGRLEEENAELRERIREVERKQEVESAKQRLRETELEDKLGNIIRTKTEAERHSQDLIDAAEEKAEETARALEETRGELQVRQEEVAALRKDLEQALVEKEGAEERVQASLLQMGKEKKTLEEERAALESRAEEALALAEGLKEREKTLLREAEEGVAKESALEEELREFRKKAGDDARKAAAEVSRLESVIEELQARREELEGLRKTAGEKDRTLQELKESLEASEKAVASLDEEVGGWRHRCAEAEAAIAEVAAREAQLQREKDELKAAARETAALAEERKTALEEAERRLAETEADGARLASLLEEKDKDLKFLEEKLDGAHGTPSAWEELAAEKDAALGALEEELKKVEGSRAAAQALLQEKNEALTKLESSLEEARRSAGLLEEERRKSRALEEDLQRRREEIEYHKGQVGKAAEAQREGDERRRSLEGKVGELEKALAEERADRRRDEEVRRAEEETGREKVRELEGLLAEERIRVREAGAAAAEAQREGDERRRSLEGKVGELEKALAEERADRRRDEEVRRAEEEAGREKVRELEGLLAEERIRVREAGAAATETEKVQQMLSEVVAKAQEEVIERTRREVELRERLKTSVEEKKFLLSRLERELREAGARERRLSDLLGKALRGSEQLAASLGEGAGRLENLPAVVVEPPAKSTSSRPFLAAGLAALFLAGSVWLALQGGGSGPRGREGGEPGASAPQARGDDPLASQREIWEEWTRSDVSGGVLMQATLRSPEEIAAEVEAEKKSRGWSDEEAEKEYQAIVAPYRFEDHFYFYLYLKNLEPGYPSYVDDIHDQLALRDDKGNEAEAFLPPDLEKHRRVYSFTSGELSKSREGLVYEVTVPVAFARDALVSRPSYIQLLAYNIGASSRRVLTWEME